jgi:serine protease Do
MRKLSITGFISYVVLLSFSMASSVAQARGLPDFTSMVEKYSPAVVNISTTQKIKRSSRLPEGLEIPDIPEDSPLHDFFKHFFGDGEGNGQPYEYDAKSLGSGFIISEDGYVITNNHVVRDADEIVVRLSDRREYVAKIIGTDEPSDIALLKIEDNGELPVVKIGKSSDMKVGEWVLAIGSPFGFDHSVTAGIVSAKGRSLPRENYVPFIQTDVAINPGNSGGPLFNLDGEVVGVNSQIYSRTGGFMGLSFAIPIEVAMNVADQLRTTGHVTRGWLGVLIQDVTRELAESFNMDKPMGALVSRVLDDSPASKAGFEVGDIITRFNGEEILRSKDLPPLVGRTPVDKRVPVRVLRKGRQHTLHVMIGELPDKDELQIAGKPKTSQENRIGVTVTDLTTAQRKAYDVAENGVVVTTIVPGAAFKAGIRKGDIILRLNDVEVKGVKHFAEIVDKLPDDHAVPVLIQRKSGPVFVAMKLAKDEK